MLSSVPGVRQTIAAPRMSRDDSSDCVTSSVRTRRAVWVGGNPLRVWVKAEAFGEKLHPPLSSRSYFFISYCRQLGACPRSNEAENRARQVATGPYVIRTISWCKKTEHSVIKGSDIFTRYLQGGRYRLTHHEVSTTFVVSDIISSAFGLSVSYLCTHALMYRNACFADMINF